MGEQGQGGWPTAPQAPPPPGPPGWPPQPPPPHYPPPPPPSASGRAVAAFILAILSWAACAFFTGIPAIILAKIELNAIERGESPVAGRGLSQAAFWIGLVNTVCLLCVPAIAIFVMAIVGANRKGLGF